MNLLSTIPLLLSSFLPEPLVGTWQVPHDTNDGIQITVNLWASGDADGIIIIDPESRSNASKRSWRGRWHAKSSKGGGMVLTLEGVSQVFGNDSIEKRSFLDEFSCQVSEISVKQFQCSVDGRGTTFFALGR